MDDIHMGKHEKREAFCVLLYCTHVLGDHKAYSLSSYKKHKGKIMPIAGYENETTIISDLIWSINTLFPGQQHSEVIRKLETENIKIRNLVSDETRMSTQEGIEEYKAFAENLIEIMSQHVPQMLQEEPFFNSVFPRNSLYG